MTNFMDDTQEIEDAIHTCSRCKQKYDADEFQVGAALCVYCYEKVEMDYEDEMMNFTENPSIKS